MKSKGELVNAKRGGTKTLSVRRRTDRESSDLPITRQNELLKKIRHSMVSGQATQH